MTKVLISSEKISTSINGAQAFRIRYHSTDLNGKATESTGLVIAHQVSTKKAARSCRGLTELLVWEMLPALQPSLIPHVN